MHIIGNGVDIIKKSRINNSLKIKGFLNIIFINSNDLTIEDFLKEIDILIIQNRYEGFCRPIMIALKMGKQIIAPNSNVYYEFLSL